MPISEERIRHLLRRTEFVDRQARVDELLALGSIGDAVDNVMAVAVPGTIPIGSGENWEQGQNLTSGWLDRMAEDARPFGERMSFFWHGHICSELGKVNSTPFMAEQVELFRRDAVNGNVGQLMKDMSIQVAMLRYLDNDRNIATSPNQNFAREMMELFVLGVGNYTEADVEASTDAWTGWTAPWNAAGGSSSAVRTFSQEQHTRGALPFFGRTINQIRLEFAGFETIDVLLWLDHTYASGPGGSTSYSGQGGVVPAGADLETNRGRKTSDVAAEFLSKKLWQEFGEATSGGVPPDVLADMVDALLDDDFDIKPWLRAMLVHDDFYPDTNPMVAGGLVRQPVEYAVALMVALGRSAGEIIPFWLMELSGQVLLYPPNVSGWKPNGYWVNASAFEARNRIAQGCLWPVFDDYWNFDWEERYKNFIELPGGKIYQHEIVGGQGLPAPYNIEPIDNAVLVDRILDYTDLHFSTDGRKAIVDFCASHWNDAVSPGVGNQYERREALLLTLLAPEMHIN